MQQGKLNMWAEILSSYTVRIVLMGTVLLGIVGGIIGVFLTLKKQSLVGDALSHSALPGVVLAYIITQRSTLFVSVIGAILASVFALYLMNIIKKYSKIKNDAILAIILAGFFGFGQVLLSIIRDTAGQDQARLNTFIFGQAATMSIQDIIFLVIILTVVLILVLMFWRHIKIFIFNREFYQSLGFSGKLINVILNALVVLVVVSGIQTVGVILMSALLIAPGVAARLWSNRLGINVILAAFFGAISGFLGTIFGLDMATGPVIVIFVTSIVILSLLFAPKSGFIWSKIAERIHKYQINKYHGLIHFFETGTIDEIPKESLDFLVEKGFFNIENEVYDLTPRGKDKVYSIMAGEFKWI